MASKHRSLKRRSHKRTKRSRLSRRSRRSHGGVAPVSHQDMGWPAKMSLGQGADYLKYHVGQHGGLQGADLSSIGNDALPDQLRASAHISGLDKAFADIRGLSDHSGGRRSRSKRSKSKSKSKKSKRSKSKKSKRSKSKKSKSKRSKSVKRRRGGALGYASFPSAGMLLSPSDYDKAGLNPQWRDVEFDAARVRAGL